VMVRDTAVDLNGEHGRGINVNESSSALVEQCFLKGNREAGINVIESTAHLVDTVVQDTLPEQPGINAMGVAGVLGSTLTMENCAVAGTQGWGIGLSKSTATLDRIYVADTVCETLDGRVGGWGLGLKDMEHFEMTNSTVVRNWEIGLTSWNSPLSIDSCLLAETRPNPDGMGRGMELKEGSPATISNSVVSGTTQLGFLVVDSEVELTHSLIEATATDDQGWHGYGLALFEGGSVAVSSSLIDQSHTAGISLVAGSSLEMDSCVVRRTQPNGGEAHGYGISAREGASLDMNRSAVVDSHAAGVYLLESDGLLVASLVSGVAESKASWLVDGELVDVPEKVADGVVVLSAPGGFSLESTLVEDCARAGLVLSGSKVYLAGNVIADSRFGLVDQESEVVETGTYFLDNDYNHNPNPGEALPVSNEPLEMPEPVAKPDWSDHEE